MITSRLAINKAEAAAILPGLEAAVNAIVGALHGCVPRIDPRIQFPCSAVRLYANAQPSETMAGHLMSARNKLKAISGSRKVRLNSFELAACAFALRLVQKEALVSEDVLAKVSALADKLEKYRKRAKRAAVKAIGRNAYKEQAESWRRHLQFTHCILCYRPVRSRLKSPRLGHRDQREQLLRIAKEVAPTADPARLLELVDLARREVRRGRHGTKLRTLLSDEARAKQFMAQFILKRDGPDVLAPEFQPLDVRQSACGERMKIAMVIDESEESEPEVSVKPTATEHCHASAKAATAGVSSKTPAALSVPVTDPQPVPSLKELALLYTKWLVREFDPGDWGSITKQTQLEIWRPYREPKYATAPKTVVSSDAEIRPAYLGSDAFEANNLYAIWGATWLIAKNPNPNTVARAATEGLRLADEWERMIYGNQKDKLSAIYLRSRP
jgi:hypothetical protein